VTVTDAGGGMVAASSLTVSRVIARAGYKVFARVH
jgi:hypothetical protein